MIENYEAVLFDLDGTLVDSMWLWHAIDVEYLAGFGLEVPDDLGSAIDGMGFSETAAYFKERFNIPDSNEKIKETWNNMAYEFYCTRVPLKSGARDFLKYLKSRGIKTAIGTSNLRKMFLRLWKYRIILIRWLQRAWLMQENQDPIYI